MRPAPYRFGFICGACGHGMRQVCDTCEQQEAERRGLESALDARGEQNARDLTRGIPGVAELEDLLGVRVTVEPSVDEDENVIWEASAVLAREKCWAVSGDMDSAVNALRARLVKELRDLADDLEEMGLKAAEQAAEAEKGGV